MASPVIEISGQMPLCMWDFVQEKTLGRPQGFSNNKPHNHISCYEMGLYDLSLNYSQLLRGHPRSMGG